MKIEGKRDTAWRVGKETAAAIGPERGPYDPLAQPIAYWRDAFALPKIRCPRQNSNGLFRGLPSQMWLTLESPTASCRVRHCGPNRPDPTVRNGGPYQCNINAYRPKPNIHAHFNPKYDRCARMRRSDDVRRHRHAFDSRQVMKTKRELSSQ